MTGSSSSSPATTCGVGLLGSNPIAGALTADLTDQQRGEVREVLDRMLRERGGGRLPAVLTAGMNIAIGTT